MSAALTVEVGDWIMIGRDANYEPLGYAPLSTTFSSPFKVIGVRGDAVVCESKRIRYVTHEFKLNRVVHVCRTEELALQLCDARRVADILHRVDIKAASTVRDATMATAIKHLTKDHS